LYLQCWDKDHGNLGVINEQTICRAPLLPR
jgi:hypothetical protein